MIKSKSQNIDVSSSKTPRSRKISPGECKSGTHQYNHSNIHTSAGYFGTGPATNSGANLHSSSNQKRNSDEIDNTDFIYSSSRQNVKQSMEVSQGQPYLHTSQGKNRDYDSQNYENLDLNSLNKDSHGLKTYHSSRDPFLY